MTYNFIRPIVTALALPSACKFNVSLTSFKCFRIGEDGKRAGFGCRSYADLVPVERERQCKQFNPKKEATFKPVTHVIFDLDGTILNSEEINYQVSAEYVGRVFKKKLEMDLYGMMMGTLAKDAAALVLKELQLPISTDVYLHGIWQKLRPSLMCSKEMPGINYLVCHFERCKIPMAVATSSSKETFNLKTKRHKKLFSKFCPIIMGGSEKTLTRGKPHPDIFTMTAFRFPEPPDRMDQILVFEDSMNGVKAAKAAGMQAVMIPSPTLPRHFIEMAQPDKIITSFQHFDPVPFSLPPYPKK